MKVAFASSDGVVIDQHFGWSKAFYLYFIDKEEFKLLNMIDASKEIEGEKEKLTYKIEILKEADIIYSTQIGPTASKMVQASGIHPAKVAEGEKIEEAITKLQEMLNNSPAPWLLRIYHKSRGA
jgi:nitrogen fixation protein NifX